MNKETKGKPITTNSINEYLSFTKESKLQPPDWPVSSDVGTIIGQTGERVRVRGERGWGVRCRQSSNILIAGEPL